ncbi:oligosaccharide flippase family protein [Roseateles noduli]|uniref:oligosaccharide flippase family protein n=1 Tax=Roseateles noduli TaxID=2052484 RepID=UPI003D65EB24
MKSTTAVLAGWSARVVVVACSLVNTRLLLNMLDVPAYAVYAIVLSLGPWFNLLALGVPNTAQNAIARHRAEGTDHRRLQHTVVNTAAAAAALALVLCWPIGWVVQHTVLSGQDGMPTSAVALMCFGLCLTALTPVFNQVLFGLHRGLWPNVMPGLQSLTTTALLLTMSSLGLNGIDWAVATFAGPALLVFVVLAKVAGAAPRHGIDWRQLKQVMVEGRHFLLFGLLSTGALSADYIVMARTLASPAIVEYNLASKVFTVLLTIHAVVLSTSWSSLSDLHYRGHTEQLRRRVRSLLLVGVLVVLPAALLVVALQADVFRLIGGARTVTVSMALLALWPVYLLIRVWCDTFALAHMSAGRVGTMNAYVAGQTAVSVAGQIWLGNRYGPAGILAGISLSFLVTAAWILPVRFVHLTRANGS